MRNNVQQPPGSCCHHRPDRYHTGRGRLQDWPSTPLSNPLVAAEASVELPCGYEPSAWEGLTKRLAKSHALTFAAECHHGGHQVQQWPSEVVLGGHDHVVVHAEVIDGDAGGWAVGHRDTDSASGEILP